MEMPKYVKLRIDDEALHSAFRVLCFKRSTNMQERLLTFLQKDVEAEAQGLDFLEGDKPQPSDEDNEVKDLCCDFLKRLADGEKVANGELVALGHLLGVRPEILKRIRDRYLDGEVKNDQSIAAS